MDPESISKAQPAEGRLSDPFARTVLDSLSANIAIIDAEGRILDTNQAWREYATTNDMEGSVDSVGENYLTVCRQAAEAGDPDAAAVVVGIKAVAEGRQEIFLYDYPCHSPEEKHWYYMRAVRVLYSGPVRIIVSHEDITALKLTEESLRQHEAELEQQTQSLEEANIALKVLLKQRESDKHELEQKVLSNVRQLVLPYVEKLKTSRLKPRDRTLLEIIESHLDDVISPFLQRMSTAKSILTPQEIQVAALVKEGRTSQEIADILNVSVTTINFHRKNLRQKFGLRNTSTNLRSHLMSMT
ncbi:MAG: LuxR C-terminal-related transcriptional regulator [Desulfobacteraceae bacterium]|nr:LuxR C-terminal-related transcriptional regulator [Desulfobacteraceae bacterium]